MTNTQALLAVAASMAELRACEALATLALGCASAQEVWGLIGHATLAATLEA
jgi:hypothetical protein